MQNVDITIVGAGSAGLTLAALLAPLNLSIVVLEQGAAPRQQAATYQRVSALNLASQRLLSHIGAWPAIASSAAAYSQMQVWDADSFARIAFDAQTEGVAALGHICDNEQIRLALYQQLQCRALGSGKETQQTLQYLLVDIVHCLIMDRAHRYLPGIKSFMPRRLTHQPSDN